MNSNTLIIICIATVFLHIADDFYLQGILANLKQREWWKENARNNMYRNDYMAALIIHGLSWSIMVHTPIMIYRYMHYQSLLITVVSIMFNLLIHSHIDNQKANLHTINLIKDQICHGFQLILILIIGTI